MRRSIYFLYGVVAYATFFITFLYAFAFVGNLFVPKTIDSGAAGPIGTALAIDAALLLLFALQHSGMARPAFKRWWTRIVPQEIERSTYVLLASGVLLLLFALWQPIPQTVWDVREIPAAATVLTALFVVGWVLVLLSTFMIGHANLFGLQQVWIQLRNAATPADGFQTPWLYAFVRHPIMLGFLIGFWATPVMTVGHLLFAVATTGYIVLAVRLEERDLVAKFGDVYQEYKRRVPAFVPVPKGGIPASRSREKGVAG